MIASRFRASSLERGNGFVLVSSEYEERGRFTYLRAGSGAPGAANSSVSVRLELFPLGASRNAESDHDRSP